MTFDIQRTSAASPSIRRKAHGSSRSSVLQRTPAANPDQPCASQYSPPTAASAPVARTAPGVVVNRRRTPAKTAHAPPSAPTAAPARRPTRTCRFMRHRPRLRLELGSRRFLAVNAEPDVPGRHHGPCIEIDGRPAFGSLDPAAHQSGSSCLQPAQLQWFARL